MSNKSNQVKLEEKVLNFVFEIVQAQFNKNGLYFLKISVQHGHRKDLLSQVLLDVNNTGKKLLKHSTKSDSVRWHENSASVFFEKHHFRFILPQGFCKNDKNYDVYLFIEAFLDAKPPKRVGEALFAIYPRTESPRANLLVKKGEDYYKYAGILTLLRPQARASTSMHCGRLSYAVALSEFVEPTENIVDDYKNDEEIEKDDEIAQTASKESEIIITPPLSAGNDSLTFIKEQTLKPTLSPFTVKHKAALMNEKEQSVGRKSSNQSNIRSSRLDFNEYLHQPLIEEAINSNPEVLSEGSFHLSIASTPPPDISPSSKQRTMDTPAGDHRKSGKKSSPKHTSKRTSQIISKSPTMTSPQPPNSDEPINRHVAKPGFEEIYTIIHGATSLPSRSDGADPIPFATLKNLNDEQSRRIAQCSTHASLGPTHSPTWEEILTMEVPEDKAESEEMVLTVADSTSKEKLVTFNLPISKLVPFHPYHFELVKPTKSIPSGIRVYVTILRKLSHLPRLQGFGFCGLEVTLQNFQDELSNSAGSLIAVSRIVPDYTTYKDTMLTRHPISAGITTTTITFPSPNPSAFEVSRGHQQGFPQLTTISKNNSKPTWNHIFMFCSNEAATLFAPNSALVIEFYSASTTMTAVTWTIRSPIGFSTLLLDDELFQALTSNAGRMGIRVDDLLVQGSQFETVNGSYPSIQLLLRLITTERPDTMVVASDASLLPTLDSIPSSGVMQKQPSEISNDISQLYIHDEDEHFNVNISEQPRLGARGDTTVGGPPFERKKTRVLVKEDEYPPKDALETILPDYLLTENDSTSPRMNTLTISRNPTLQPDQGTSDNHSKSLLDHHAKELAKYREAVRRMSNDVVALRQNNTELQQENARLRRELLLNKEVGQTVMDDLNKGVISSSEFADKFVAVRQKLAKDNEDLSKYKTKVHLLQNQMIKANEREKQYLSENLTRKELEESVQHLHDKLKKSKKLEETCVQQEQVIQKMEKLLNKYMKKTSSPPKHEAIVEDQQSAVAILSQENAKLQQEINEVMIRQQHFDTEKSNLLDRLERAENRVTSLESQLDHDARTWAKEKHELTVRLQEHRNGILRTTGANIKSDSFW